MGAGCAVSALCILGLGVDVAAEELAEDGVRHTWTDDVRVSQHAMPARRLNKITNGSVHAIALRHPMLNAPVRLESGESLALICDRINAPSFWTIERHSGWTTVIPVACGQTVRVFEEGQ